MDRGRGQNFLERDRGRDVRVVKQGIRSGFIFLKFPILYSSIFMGPTDSTDLVKSQLLRRKVKDSHFLDQNIFLEKPS